MVSLGSFGEKWTRMSVKAYLWASFVELHLKCWARVVSKYGLERCFLSCLLACWFSLIGCSISWEMGLCFGESTNKAVFGGQSSTRICNQGPIQ